MLRSLDDLLSVVDRLYPKDPPRPFLLLRGVRRVQGGEDEKAIRRSVRARAASFASWVTAADPVQELDMHFSLKDDLTPLQDFLVMLKDHGLHGLTARLERGLV